MTTMSTSFSDLVKGDKPVLVDFYATWCGPCKAMAPELEKLAQQQPDDLKVIKIDVDRNPKAAASYQIRSVPTLMLFSKGKVLWKQSGFKSAAELKQMIAKALATQN